MIKDKTEIKEVLMDIFRAQEPTLKITAETEYALELSGTKEAMQGRTKVDAYYFGTVMEKSKGTRLYFNPIYTHPDRFEGLSDALKSIQKHQNSFNVDHLDDELIADIKALVKKGVEIYKEHDLI